MKKYIITTFVFLAVAGMTHASSFQWSGKLIKYGSVGAQVSSLQECMNSLGYNTGKVDGIYGPNTYMGIKSFQKAKGYKQDGIVGPQTKVGFEKVCNIGKTPVSQNQYNHNTKTNTKQEMTQNNRSIKTVSSKLSDISTKIPASLGDVYTKNFNRYTAVVAPNGKSIHIVAQNKISNEQILRARNILLHYLNNFPGSKYGADKTQVANKMAENGATLALLNGQDDGSNPMGEKVSGQPLYQNEIQTEGGDWYMKQNYEHRDAAYEEILHFVHDNGIGVDGKNTMPGALPEYQSRIRTAQKNGLSKNLWGRGAENKSWIKELSQENSLSQEYLASVIDSYYGLWGAWSEGTGGMWDIYIAKKRSDMKQQDRLGYEVVQEFFHPYVTYNARIEPSFSGTFSLKFDSSKPYTHHSQYLKDVTLFGSNNSNVVVNGFDNIITGNAGNNTVVFSGNASEYTITKNGNTTIVEDTKTNRDGKNTLQNIEKVKFSDGEKNL